MARLPRSATTSERFWAKVEKTDTCWLWASYIKPNGYATFWEPAVQSKVYVHRWVYEQEVGPIPEGLEIDHLCSVRHCVNPDHLEPVTHHENMLRGDTIAARNARKTQCPRGHALVVEYDRGRRCIECHAAGPHNADKTHCKRGHEFNDENTYWFPDGSGRGCRTCRRAANANRRQKVAA